MNFHNHFPQLSSNTLELQLTLQVIVYWLTLFWVSSLLRVLLYFNVSVMSSESGSFRVQTKHLMGNCFLIVCSTIPLLCTRTSDVARDIRIYLTWSQSRTKSRVCVVVLPVKATWRFFSTTVKLFVRPSPKKWDTREHAHLHRCLLLWEPRQKSFGQKVYTHTFFSHLALRVFSAINKQQQTCWTEERV